MIPWIDPDEILIRFPCQVKTTHNIVLYKGTLFIFDFQSHLLISRYLVLNQAGLFVYKDEELFEKAKDKPIIVIPLLEIKTLSVRNFDAEHMLQCKNANSIGGTDKVYAMEIRLKESYNVVRRSIWKYAFYDIKNYMEEPDEMRRSKVLNRQSQQGASPEREYF